MDHHRRRAVLVTLAIIAAAGSRSSTLRRLVIDTLAERLDSEVQLQTFSVDLFPTVDVRGEGLASSCGARRHAAAAEDQGIRDQGRAVRAAEPSAKVQRASRSTAWRSTFHLAVLISTSTTTAPPARTGRPASSSPIQIEHLEATDAMLRLIPKRAGKPPREFLIHRLRWRASASPSRMPFKAELTNPIPRGEIQTEGRFGPWSRESPGATPVEGNYSFHDADLSTIKGIGGILSSTGEFRGPLGRIEVKGETQTPDFRLNVAGNPHAAVDDVPGGGRRHGRRHLPEAVNAKLGKTPIAGERRDCRHAGVKGRTVQLHAKIADGRIEDLLRLSVKARAPADRSFRAAHRFHAAAGTRRRRGADAAGGQLRPVVRAVHQRTVQREARRDERACERRARRCARRVWSSDLEGDSSLPGQLSLTA